MASLLLNSLASCHHNFLSNHRSPKKLAEDLEKIEGWPYPEFSDKAKFNNFVYMMKQTKFFKEDSEGKLSASKITKKAQNLYEQFFDKDFLELIERQSN